jgi:S-methylmethionine-dependent homocysteine/selenocysteine methylase
MRIHINRKYDSSLQKSDCGSLDKFCVSCSTPRRTGTLTLGGAETVRRLNAAAAMHNDIRSRSEPHPVYVAGVIGPSGDAYLPGEALPSAEASDYHEIQAETLAGSGVDFLYAPTFPALGEALGVARAMAATGLP